MAKSRTPMNFRQWWDAVGTANVQKVVDEVGSSIRYFRHLRYGIKRPGREFSLRILAAARKHTAPFEPDLELMLQGVPRAGKNPAKPIEAEERFIRARRRFEKEQVAA